MIWTVCFISAVCILCICILWAVGIRNTRYKRGKILNPFNVIFAGVVVSSGMLFIPIYADMFMSERFGVWKTLLLTIHNTIRLFIVDGEFSIIADNMGYVPENLADIYETLAAVLFVVAPFLTFGVVLSFFKNISAYKDYFFKYFSDVYIFSELNEQSITLAKSLKRNNKKRLIVFTDVFEVNEESYYELTAQAYELGAVLFKKDIAVVNFKFHSKNSKLVFFIIGKNDDENVKQTLSLITRYHDSENVSLYSFTTSINSELLLNKAVTGKLKVRRINEVQSLISRHLYDEGMEIFHTAVQDGEGEKLISAVVIGLGQRGTEMTKALSWFGQMDGYRLEINVFDADLKAESRFCYQCPELMDDKHNNDFTTEGEAHYKIQIHSGVDIETKEFTEMLKQIKRVTYVFVSLGDDEKNIRVAISLRSWFKKNGCHPQINAVVRNSDKKAALYGVTNYSNQKYDINFIGDIYTTYSEEVVFESDIESAALKRHMCWGDEESFWKYEYNYRSSIASVIHRKMKIGCNIPGVCKQPEDRTEEEKWALRDLEHRRWNAYMRSEGFTFAKERNNLAKTHHCLVPFKDLPLKEQEKDDD